MPFFLCACVVFIKVIAFFLKLLFLLFAQDDTFTAREEPRPTQAPKYFAIYFSFFLKVLCSFFFIFLKGSLKIWFSKTTRTEEQIAKDTRAKMQEIIEEQVCAVGKNALIVCRERE